MTPNRNGGCPEASCPIPRAPLRTRAEPPAPPAPRVRGEAPDAPFSAGANGFLDADVELAGLRCAKPGAPARAQRLRLFRAPGRQSRSPKKRPRLGLAAGRGRQLDVVTSSMTAEDHALCRRASCFCASGLFESRPAACGSVPAARPFLAPPPPAACGSRPLRRGEVLRQRERDLLDRAELLASLVEELRRARRVALRRGEERRADRQRQLERGLDELRGVLLVPVAARVRERAEEPLRLRVLRRGAAVLRLARRAREPPRPAREDLLGRVGLLLGDRPEEDADPGEPLLLPRSAPASRA